MKKLILSATVLLALSSLYASDYKTTVIDGNTYTVDTLAHFKAGPGSHYTAIKFEGQSLTFRTFYLEVDTRQADIAFRTELGRDSVIGCELISAHAARKSVNGEHYFAAVNGDFFETQGDVGTPVNGSVHNGMLGTVASAQPHFIVDTDLNTYASYVTASNTYSVNGGSPIALDRVNARIGENQIFLFNSANGNYTHTPAGTTEIALELLPGEQWMVNRTVKAKVVGKASSAGNMAIAAGQAVLSATGSKAESIAALKVGDAVDISVSMQLNQFDNTTPKFGQMVGGNVIFLQGGQTTPQGDYARHPRTMLGYNKDHSKMIFAVVDGRSSISSGATYVELADLMKWVGAWDAINIDGGGSSSLYLQKFGPMNVPSDGPERAVGNGVYCVLKAPEDNNIAEIRFVDWAMKFPKYGVYTPVFYGYNQYGMLIDTDVKGVTLSCDPAIGEIINDGTTFYGKGDGSGALKASFNGLEASIPVVVAANDQVSFRLSDVVIDNVREYPVEVQALVNEKQMPMNPSALNWASANPEIATVGADNGVLRGVANGKTTVSGTVGAFSGSLNVTVEIPNSPVMPIVKNIVADEWTLKQTGGKGIAISGLDNGFSLGYTGNGAARGAYISADRTCQIWSLPTKLQVRINPGEAIVKKVSANISNALGEKVTSWTITDSELPKNEESVLAVNLSDNFNLEDIGIFPISVNSLRLDMGKSDKDKNYQIAVPGFEAVYEAGGAVETIETDALRIYPNPVVAGQPFSVEAEGNAVVQVFSLSGVKLLETPVCGRSLIPTADMAPGIYIIKASAENNSKTSKLIVR